MLGGWGQAQGTSTHSLRDSYLLRYVPYDFYARYAVCCCCVRRTRLLDNATINRRYRLQASDFPDFNTTVRAARKYPDSSLALRAPTVHVHMYSFAAPCCCLLLNKPGPACDVSIGRSGKQCGSIISAPVLTTCGVRLGVTPLPSQLQDQATKFKHPRAEGESGVAKPGVSVQQCLRHVDHLLGWERASFVSGDQHA